MPKALKCHVDPFFAYFTFLESAHMCISTKKTSTITTTTTTTTTRSNAWKALSSHLPDNFLAKRGYFQLQSFPHAPHNSSCRQQRSLPQQQGSQWLVSLPSCDNTWKQTGFTRNSASHIPSLPNSFTRAHWKVLARRQNKSMLPRAGTSLHKVETWQVNVLKTFIIAVTNSHAQDHMPSQHASAKTSPKPEVHATHLDAQVHKPHCWSITEKRLVLAIGSEIQNTGRGTNPPPLSVWWRCRTCCFFSFTTPLRHW